MDPTRKDRPPIEAKLGLWDAVSIIVGIIIGVGIFATPASIFNSAPDVWAGLGVWLLGGLVALLGALCFAELATTYPRSGGEYVYLTRAFGPLAGYLFAWAQLTIIRPGSIGAVAYVFAVNAESILQLGGASVFLLACGSIALLTFINVMGVVLGAWTQNLLTLAKVLGLVALVVVGFAWGSPDNLRQNPAASTASARDTLKALVLMMVPVLWTYSGWQEAAYVVAEIKDRRRNIARALLWGTAIVTVIYVVVNAAYLYGLGFSAIHAPGHPIAAKVLGLALPGSGDRAMAVLVIVSALGAINGMIFTTARIYAEFGLDHRLFSALSHWSRRLRTPARALVVQGIISLLVVSGVSLYVYLLQARTPIAAASIVGLATAGGPNSVVAAALAATTPDLRATNVFDELIDFTAAVFWLFFLATGVAFFVLRHIDFDLPRPFRVPLYPVIPLVFCGCCAAMAIGVFVAKFQVSLVGLGIVVVGLPLYFWPRKKQAQPAQRELEPVGR